MKFLPYSLLILLLLFSCKEQAEKSGTPASAAETTEMETADFLQQVAEQHGYASWAAVQELRFTFNVDRGDNHYERSWIWKPKTNEVTGISAGDTTTYLRSAVDSTLMDLDAGFINDKYWLLAPYQLVWDRDNFEHSITSGVTAPISGEPSEKLTIVYGSEGGYTPGDAYDFYLDADKVVREWAFRKGNQEEPNMITTWEGYQDMGGLKIATDHNNAEGGFRLFFSGVQVITE